MKRVSRLALENFQSHVRSELRFSPGLNVIVGPSDQGKTALIRALRWVLYNEPRGTEFVRAGSDFCRVTVEFDDGVQIVRERGPGVNRYLLREDGRERVFEAVGTGVPPEIAAAHGMPFLKLDADRPVLLNVALQLEAPFLLLESGSLRAKAIGQVTGVHVLDAAIRDVVAEEGRVAREEARLVREMEEWEEKLREFDNLPAQEEALNRAEKVLQQARQLRERSLRLRRWKEAWERVEEQSRRAERILAGLRDLPRAEVLLRECQLAGEKWARLRRWQTRWQETAAGLGRWRVVAERLQGVERGEELRARAESLVRREEKLRGIQKRWEQNLEAEKRLREQRVRAQREESEARRRYGEILARLGRCPTCGAPLEAARVGRIVEDLFGGQGSGTGT